MIPTQDKQLEDACNRRGYAVTNLKALFRAVYESNVYIFRRPKGTSVQYEVEMPGYGKPAKMDKWCEIRIIKGLSLRKDY